jgi:hypothetical protein
VEPPSRLERLPFGGLIRRKVGGGLTFIWLKHLVIG